MKNVIPIAALCVLCTTATAAEVPQPAGPFLCIADMATGFAFDQKRKKWTSVSFDVGQARYTLKRIPNPGLSNRWSLSRFGASSGTPESAADCQRGFNGAMVIVCALPNLLLFRFDAETGRFLFSYLGGYTESSSLGMEGGDKPIIQIGTCSAL